MAGKTADRHERSGSPYVLVTPARNEVLFIENTLRSVTAQTVLPARWVIVSDGSSDGTDDVVLRYANRYPFIELLRLPDTGERNFGAKVRAVRAGLDRLEGMEYGFFGNLDADVSFAPEYFERLLSVFEENPALGIAGGLVYERLGESWVRQKISSGSVAGPVQLFRRECWEDIGGYIPLPKGGVDAAAEIMARMRGWECRTVTSLDVREHRRVGTAGGHVLGVRFRQGAMFRSLGYHPLFQLMKTIVRFSERPLFVGSMLTLLGYTWSSLRRDPVLLNSEAVEYLQAEQLSRITAGFLGAFHPGRKRSFVK